MKRRYANETILVFSDYHAPYQHEEALDFLSDVKRDIAPDRVICNGDLLDMYNFSFYGKDPDHIHNHNTELKNAVESVKAIASLFPKMVFVMGNHDDRYRRQATSSSIPTLCLRKMRDVFCMPSGWKVKDDRFRLTVNSTRRSITFRHHWKANSLTVAQQQGECIVQSHQHAKANIQYAYNGHRNIWGMNTPNLISNTGCPFRYSKQADINPVRGCAVIEAGEPRIILL